MGRMDMSDNDAALALNAVLKELLKEKGYEVEDYEPRWEDAHKLGTNPPDTAKMMIYTLLKPELAGGSSAKKVEKLGRYYYSGAASTAPMLA